VEINLLAAEHGGQLVAAASEAWAKAITGNDADDAAVGLGQEAVYAFKDEKPAAFGKFHILIAGAYGGNVKDFELMAGDESPVGNFRPLGKFTTSNVRLIKTPYQEFSFATTMARYLKLKVLSNYGGSNLGDTYLTQIRLMGRLN
jgi:hypothetical protein